MKLTPRKKQVLEFINSYSRKRGFAPSIPEIAKRFKLAISTVHQHLEELETAGHLQREKNQPRSIDIVGRETMMQVPLLGTIAAGQPLTLFNVPKETIAVPKSKIPSSSEVYALRVVGNSMIDENINDGDVILVRHQKTAENGQKVVALLDNNVATLKKFYRERGQIRLQPANRTMPAIILRRGEREFVIQGVFLDVIKRETEQQSAPESIRQITIPRYEQEKCSPSIRRGGFEFYLGDSLKVITALHRKYTAIYLDPPFNTNRNYKYQATDDTHIFADRWADDEYEKWIDSLISVCKSKLEKNGTLFFHISAELSFAPEKVLRKHFKKVEPIFWKKAHGKNTVKNKLGSVIDIIFKASDNGSKFNLLHVPLDEYYFENSYRNKDAVGYYALGSIKHDKTRRGYFYALTKDGVVYEAPYGWKIPREKLDKLIKEGRIHFARPKPGSNKAMLYKKLYKHEVRGKPLSNLWDDIAYITRTTQDERLYPTQKPLNLLKRIVELSSDKGDWILDPVAGSGTAGMAALALGRNVTLIDKSREAERAIKIRLKKWLDGEGQG